MRKLSFEPVDEETAYRLSGEILLEFKYFGRIVLVSEDKYFKFTIFLHVATVYITARKDYREVVVASFGLSEKDFNEIVDRFLGTIGKYQLPKEAIIDG